MDFVKREDNHVLEEENYKLYMQNLQKSHQIDTTEYQHTAISMEQLHQAVQSTLNNGSLHNFQLPISPRQMSTLMLKTNHLTRSLTYNDLPQHLSKNLAMDMELLPMTNEIQQIRHEDILSQNLSRNLDITLARNLNNELELQNSLAQIQSLHEHEMSRNAEITQNLSRVNELTQNMGRELSHELINEIDLSQLSRHGLDQNILSHDEGRRSPIIHSVDNHLLEHHIAQRLEQNIAMRLDSDRLDQTLSQRLDQTLAQRLDQTLAQRLDQTLAQRLDQTLAQRLDQRLLNPGVIHDHRVLEQNENLLPMPFHIKSEQDDDSYFYDNLNQGINTASVNNELQQNDHSQTSSIQHEQMYSLFNNTSIPALNTIDLYSRTPYIQNYPEIARENPQNLVVHRQYDNNSPYADETKKKQEDVKKNTKIEHPKENLKPNDQNKLYYDYNDYVNVEKNENDSSSHNKITEELALNIKGEYACYKCNEVFPSKRLLKQHSKNCESADSDLDKLGKFSCSQCAYRCQSPAILKIHERTHTGEKPYACTFCDYKSGQKNNVAKHILVHMKQKPFSCQYCDYKCAQKNNLVVHERTHTGYKPFACPYCDYRTVQKPNLVKHMYLHTDQKPFSCDMCNYRCVQKTNLTKHKQRHLTECDKMDIKNQVKPYKPRQKSVKCAHCSYRCVQKSSLDKHMQFKHSDIQTDMQFKQSDLRTDLQFKQSELQSDLSDGVNGTSDFDSIQNLSIKDMSQEICT
ncbi:zinc finger protein 33B-like [Danaus plexippus]|uniref:zinc finger protein 33B-like n=1 Tax=Danaus plexippus TaxID=13037 RepID=UPI002AAF77F8|nr:zinc finger protein 33B-like [Danaus plexippus]